MHTKTLLPGSIQNVKEIWGIPASQHCHKFFLVHFGNVAEHFTPNYFHNCCNLGLDIKKDNQDQMVQPYSIIY